MGILWNPSPCNLMLAAVLEKSQVANNHLAQHNSRLMPEA